MTAYPFGADPAGLAAAYAYGDDSVPPATVSRRRLLASLLWAAFAGLPAASAAASPAPAPAVPTALAMPTMRLSSGAADTGAPYTFAMQFADGQLPANVQLAGEANSQAVVKRRYPSGAAAHVIFSGRKSLPGGYLVNAPSGLAVGATSIPFDTGSGTIASGDYVWFGADKRGTQYLVSTVGSGTLTIPAPGLLAAVADDSTLIVERPVTFQATSASSSGTPLTAADIATAAPTASIALSGIGTVSLASLLSTPFETFLSGPQMVEAIYRGDFGNGTLLTAWFSVRLYAGGRVNVRAWVENGYLDNGSGAVAANATRTYTPTVTIGGTVVYNNGGSSLTHAALQTWHAEGWIGGAADVIPRHDTAYLQAARFVPGYGIGVGVSDATVAGTNQIVQGGITVPTLNGITKVYTPLGLADQSAEQKGEGFQRQIGLLPLWYALYFSTGGDPRAWRALRANSLSTDTYGIRFRNATTKDWALPSQFPSWTGTSSGINGGANGGGPNAGGGNFGGGWEAAHFSADGYDYGLSGDYRALSTLRAQYLACYFWLPSNYGLGTDRLLTGPQVRQWAWMQRTAGLLAAVAPTGDAVAAEARAQLANTISRFKAATDEDPKKYPGASLGFYYTQSITTPLSASENGVASFMNDWRVAVMGWLSDLDLGFSTQAKADLIALRNWGYKSIVSRLGPIGDVTRYPASGLAAYPVLFGGTFVPNDGRDYTTTEQGMWEATSGGVPNNFTDRSIYNPGAASTSHLGEALAAVAYAVEHGAPGAATGYARLTGQTPDGTSNWSAVVNSANVPWADVPTFGQLPRPAVAAAAMPAWREGQALWEWREIPNSSMAGVEPTVKPYGSYSARIDAWGAIASNPVTGDIYAAANGGHNDYAGNEFLRANPITGAGWAILRQPTPAANVIYNSSFYTDGRPTSTHPYYSAQYWNGNFYRFGDGSTHSLDGSSAPGTHVYSVAAGDWDGAGTYPNTAWPDSQASSAAGQAQDASTGDVYFPTTTGVLRRFNMASRTFTDLAGMPNGIGGGVIYRPMAYDHTRGRLLIFGYAGMPADIGALWTNNGGQGAWTWVAFTGALGWFSGANSTYQAFYDADLDRFIVKTNTAGQHGQVLLVHPTTFETTVQATTGGDSIPSFGWGVFGRFVRYPVLGGYVIYPAYAGNMWFVRTK